ncbi:putative metal-nicotianamine transporter YSL6 [Prunus yedoensis var. nudiflora]|uniref:Putative metal-nicotianamine transporter YSL6 n=1 Tax=Prunus yedoensis var. nudiflora TaxID=2094558 RepID=A0A314XKK3_PRUYE|nr:putative metal-nicotianamine transporter YSL6 [Prunus yedoensis var. nudiflora]
MGTETASVEISEPLLHDSDKISPLQSVDDDDQVPEWQDQITLRALVVSALLGTLFCIITHKLNLTVGIIPSMNVGAGLLGFFFIKSWTGLLSKLGFSVAPFTRQENTVIQTCVVACYGLAFSGGFGSYLIAMDERTYNLIGADYPGNRAEDVKNPSLWWMTGFMFVVSFLGLFSLVPLRKVMVMDYKLTYPSGTATAMLINSFHTNTGVELAGNQVRSLGKYLSISLIWSCFKWFFSGVGDSCGFDNFPSFGLHCLRTPDLGSNDFKGLYGYKVFIAIALILGDGLYNLVKIITITLKEICNKSSKQSNLPVVNEVLDGDSSKVTLEQKKREEVFLKDRIPTWVAGAGYVGLVAISTATMPIIFPPLKWYLVLASYVLAPALAFCNSYGTGLTDWNLATTYGKIGLFILASLVGRDGGVIAGLAACGV